MYARWHYVPDIKITTRVNRLRDRFKNVVILIVMATYITMYVYKMFIQHVLWKWLLQNPNDPLTSWWWYLIYKISFVGAGADETSKDPSIRWHISCCIPLWPFFRQCRFRFTCSPLLNVWNVCYNDYSIENLNI